MSTLLVPAAALVWLAAPTAPLRARPFPRPASGRSAVKVINHYGDEILKMYSV